MKSATTKPRPYRQGARAEAAESTGRSIVEAFVDRIMRQWYDEITLDLIARDAGVTVQTVVRRFGGKEGLLGEAVKVLSAQIEDARRASTGDLTASVDGLVRDYERTGDAIIRLLSLEPRHKALSTFLNTGRGYHRAWVATIASESLAALTPAERERALDALVIATDVYTWQLLRRDMKRSIPATAAAMTRLVKATIHEYTTGVQR